LLLLSIVFVVFVTVARACEHCTLNLYSTAITARGRNKNDGGCE
jgi:hypothetical protein